MSALPKVDKVLYAGLVCPYCGHSDLRWYSSYERPGKVYAVCAVCGASGPFMGNREDALTEWKRVARLAQPMTPVESEQLLDSLSTPNFLRLVTLVADRLRQEPHG